MESEVICKICSGSDVCCQSSSYFLHNGPALTPHTLRATWSRRCHLLSTVSSITTYDAAAEWQIPNLEDFTATFADPYYFNLTEPDEHDFLDKKS
jgi:hypothetical protein